MSAENRRHAILQASLPLFAQRGQDGVTTLELAAACGVSEALLFRHFPSKQAMFDAIQHYHIGETKPGFPDSPKSLSSSTAELVRLVCQFVHYIVFVNARDDHEVMRLFYRSFIDDGKFARDFLSNRRVQSVKRNFMAGLEEARRSGDARPDAGDVENLFWFVQHATTAACLMRLPAKPVVRYRGPLKDAIHDLVRFALRGIGLNEAAIARHATNGRFDEWLAAPPARSK